MITLPSGGPGLASTTFLLLLVPVAAQRPTALAVEATAAVASPRAVATVRPGVLPRAVTSFGACRAGGFVYVYGGHIGREHAHSREHVVGDFGRLNLADGGSWQALPSGQPLQGTALVAAPDGSLLRLGGLTARNAAGDEADLHSTASVARFDAERNEWREATPLPEPRSSHDAVVLGHHVYVVGGWHLHGGSDGDWHRTAWAADLTVSPLQWSAVPEPGAPRRAAALAAFGGKLALAGGLGPDGMLASVRVFTPATQQWSDAPDLPGTAFGTAALGLGERLFATVADGRLLAWDGEGPWRSVAQLEMPRFFHRLVPGPAPTQVLALGGAGRGGHTRTTEIVDTVPAPLATLREVVIPTPGRVVQRQAVVVRDNLLWAFGGNRGGVGDRFAAAQFADDIWRIDLLALTASKVAVLPTGRQSLAATTIGGGAGVLLLGGLGLAPAGGGVQSLAQGLRWDERRRELTPFAELPAGRTQGALVEHGGRAWFFGGVDFTPGDDGGRSEGDGRDVLVCELAAARPAFVPAGLQLPRGRRSFAAAVLGEQVLLLGGLGEGFAVAGPADVLDLPTRTWRELELPVAWVSPQAAVIGERVYVACGGTMDGQRFREDRSLWSWSQREGWRRVVDELPFAVRHVPMLALRNRLLFYATEAGGERLVVRTLEPDPAVHVLETAMHR